MFAKSRHEDTEGLFQNIKKKKKEEEEKRNQKGSQRRKIKR